MTGTAGRKMIREVKPGQLCLWRITIGLSYIQISAAADTPARRVASSPLCYTEMLTVTTQCDKQVTDEHHQFITLTLILS